MDESQVLINRGRDVKDVWDCYRKGESLKYLPGLILRVLREDAWRDRIVAQTHKRQAFKTFREFVNTDGPEGLGIPMSTIAKICRENNKHDVLLAIEEVDRREPGGANNPDGIGGKSGKHVVNTLVECIDKDVSHNYSSGKLLARLKREQPELLDSVLAGDMTIHAASVQAGFRKKEYRLPHDPEAAGTYLAKRVSREWFDAMLAAFEETFQN